MKHARIITPVVLLVSLVSLFTDIASEMLYPVMPVYLQSIGFSIILIGVLEGMAEAVAGLSKGYFGHLSDTLEKRVPFIRGGYTLSALSKPMMAAFTFPWWIFFARTLDRLGKGIRNSARDAMLSAESLPENKGKVFGFHRAMDTLGAAIGPVLALILLQYYPGQYALIFMIAFVPGLVAVSLTLLLKEKKTEIPRKKNPGFFAYLKYWNRAGRQYKLIVAGLLAFTLFNSSDAFLLLRVKEATGSDTQMISMYIFYNLVYALAAYPLGILADRLGLKTMLFSGLAIFAIIYLGFGFAALPMHFVLLFLGYALYAAATEGVSKALISNLADKNDTATAIGFFTSFSSIFAMMASSLAGFIWFSFSAQTMFVVAAIGVVLTLLFLVFANHQLNQTQTH